MGNPRLNRHTFSAVAAAVARSHDNAAKITGDDANSTPVQGVYLCADALADAFAEAANNFDRGLFMKNCGFEE